jgi:hypothetical protein
MLTIFIGKSKEERPLVGPSHRWENTIKMDIKQGVSVSTRFIWLSTRIDGRLL